MKRGNVVKYTTYIMITREWETEKHTALKFPTHCPLVLLVKVN
jgi:hypothetical protein